MSSKLIFLLLSALFLVKCSVCKPMADEGLTKREMFQREDINRFKALLQAVNSEPENYEVGRKLLPITKVADRYLSLLINAVKYSLKKVVEDVNAKEQKSEALTAQVTHLTDFVEKFDLVANIDSPDVKFSAMFELMNSLKRFYYTLVAEITEDSIILTSMYKTFFEMKTLLFEQIKRKCEILEQVANESGTDTQTAEVKEFLDICNTEILKN